MGDNGVAAVPVITCFACLSIDTKSCIKCNKPFCAEHSSKISPNCCKDCFSEFAATVEKYTRIDEEYNEKTDSIVSHKSSSRRIRLDGPDYVWYSMAIQRLTDEELANMFQFHRFMVSLLEHTTTVRLVKATQALAGQKHSKNIITSTTTEVKKTRRVKQQKSLRDVLIASGITDEATLKAMLSAAGVTA